MPISIFETLGTACPSDKSVFILRKVCDYRRYTSTGTLAVSRHTQSSEIASQRCFENNLDSICKTTSLATADQLLFCFGCYRVAECSRLDKENFSNDLSPHHCIEDIVFIIISCYFILFFLAPSLDY